MGVLDNLKKIKKAQDNKNAVSKIARKAVVQGKIENDFLAEYNSFSIALKEILENALINDKNESITISANKEKDPEGNNLKYLNYVLQDDEYNTLYTMTMDKASNVTFKLKFIDLSVKIDSNFFLSSFKPEPTSVTILQTLYPLALQ